jgi:hypothetical protein
MVKMFAEGFTPVQTHLMLFISDTVPLVDITARNTTCHTKNVSDNGEIANQKAES